MGAVMLPAYSVAFAGNDVSYGGSKTAYDQYQLEQEGKHLAENGYYDEAIVKFQEALDPKYAKYDFQKSLAIGSIVTILTWQEKYDEAIERSKWFMEKKVTIYALEQEAFIQALKEHKKSNSKQVIYNFISRLKKDHEKELPPQGYEQINGVSTIANIIRLYDTIGDQDAGIKFIDEILAYFRTGKAGDPKPGKVDAEYIKIREAFEKDKAEGTRGRATKALIHSDYFPW